MSTNLIYWVALAQTRGLGVRTAHALLERFGSVKEIFKATRRELLTTGIGSEPMGELLSGGPLRRAEEEMKRAERSGARLISVEDPDYPRLLKQIYDPPIVLYVRGQVSALSQICVAVVGTRTPTNYGLYVAERLSADLADVGIAIVSGLARGIDTAAHRGALSANGVTVAVLGSGIDIIYPRENARIAHKIMEKGAVITEFPTGTYPAPQNFPIRNRIISGISLGAVIVEASEYSGSLITARMALEQNREVFAVPGNVTSTKSFGPNYLIKQGAKLVQDWRDVVEELPAHVRDQIRARSDEGPKGHADPAEERSPELPLMTEPESRVLGELSIEHPQHIDKLAMATGLDMSRLSEALLNLELKGLIKQLPGKNFVRR